jgi:hypothetical protein
VFRNGSADRGEDAAVRASIWAREKGRFGKRSKHQHQGTRIGPESGSAVLGSAIVLTQALDVVKSKSLPTDEDIKKLKRELNFLLWTSDAPQVPDGVGLIRANATEPPSSAHAINIQCVAHAVVMAGFFSRRGFRVTTRAGRAFMSVPGPDHNPQNDFLHEIAKHWWLSLEDYGLVDVSLSAEGGAPLIYCNRCIGGGWRVAFGESIGKLNTFIEERHRGCFYLTLNKKRVTIAECEQSLAQLVSPAKAAGVHLTHERLVCHCEDLLSARANTVTDLSQLEAWHRLAAGRVAPGPALVSNPKSRMLPE